MAKPGLDSAEDVLGGRPVRGCESLIGRRLGRAALMLVALGALLALSASPAIAKGGSVDFGDAPDGAKAGYLGKPAVVGHFPSQLASGGPRHAGLGSLRLGPTTDGEVDSHQVDKDVDDGVGLDAPKACKTATLTAAVKGSAAVAAGKFVYVNAWFDWNRDGDWADPSDGCAPEWGVRNLPVAASTVGSIAMLPIKITAGKQVTELWYRVSITLDEVQIDPSGRGRSVPYLNGETEDYLHLGAPGSPWIIEKPKPPPPPPEEKEKEEKPFTVRCVPKVRVIPHGGSATFRFLIADKGKGNIFGEFPGGYKGKGFKISLLPAANQGGLPPGFVRAGGFRYKGTEVDPPTRIQKATVKVNFKRGKVVRQAACSVVIVHVGKEPQKKEGGKKGKDEGKHEHATPPKIPPVKCESGCGGALPNPPPTKGTTLTDYELRADGTARIHVVPTDPLGGITIPLYPPNPTPVDPPKVTAGSGPIECELKPLELTGGPAAVKCKFPAPPPPALDSFFDVFFAVPLQPLQRITGTLDTAAGTPVESFSTAPFTPFVEPPIPSVSGTGTLAPGATPEAVDFKVKFDVENTTLTRFIIQAPMTQKMASGGAAGFTCGVINFKEGIERALECVGTVTSGQEIQGGFELKVPRPNQLSTSTKLFGGAGEAVHGPFNLTQTPAAATGSGVFTAPGGNVVNFTVSLSSFGALNQFTLDLPNGVQIQTGSAANPGAFTCNPIATVQGPGNALQCQNQPIKNGQPITGTMTLMAPPPVSVGANSQLFGSGPGGGPLGPFSITDGP
jgi:GEVED domain